MDEELSAIDLLNARFATFRAVLDFLGKSEGVVDTDAVMTLTERAWKFVSGEETSK